MIVQYDTERRGRFPLALAYAEESAPRTSTTLPVYRQNGRVSGVHVAIIVILTKAARHRRAVKCRVRFVARCARLVSDLPAGLQLKPGELWIELFGAEDLLPHL